MIRTRALFRMEAEVASPQIVPEGPYGARRFIPVTGGRFSGARLSGVLLPGGADCQLVRPDGAAELDVRVSLRSDDGVTFLMKGLGLRHGPPEVMARIASGEDVLPESYYFRETAMFEAPAGPLDWLNRLVAIGTGERKAGRVVIEFFEVL